MAHSNAAIGHGAVIMFEGVTTDVTNSLMANILDFDWSGISRAAIDTTHMGSGDVKTFIPGGTYDPGALSATLQFNTTATTAEHAVDALMTNAAASCTMQFNTAAYSGSAFITDMGVSAGDEDVITQAVTLKFSGAIATAATIA